MQAVIRIGGKQLLVTEGQTFFTELQQQDKKAAFEVTDVLAILDGANATIGAPVVEGAKVTLRVLDHGKGTKVKSIRYKRRKAVHKITGHRQPFSWLQVEKITKG